VPSLKEFLHAVRRARDPRDLKLRIMDCIAEPFGARAVGLYLLDEGGSLAEVYARGVRDAFIFVYEKMGRGKDPILEHALRTGRVTHDAHVFHGDDWQTSELYRECGRPWRIEHYLCAPITVDGRVAGTLNMGRSSAEHPFGQRESEWATAASRAVGERLGAFAGEVRPPVTVRPSFEDGGRLRAERMVVRLRAAELEASAAAWTEEDAAALWGSLETNRIAPLDCFDEGDRRYVVLPVEADEPPERNALTQREREVVERAAAGLANKEIAFELAISPNTVGALVRSARAKLGVGSRVKLVEAGRRMGLVGASR
jgi:DNA-binding CsgD family transcriptional regulator